jgi:hypothetical protein
MAMYREQLHGVSLVGVLAILAATVVGPARAENSLLVPVLEGKWWQIAPNAPDVGDLRTGEENACDFALFQARDGSWRCISCIRGTTAPGQRIFYQWKSDRIADQNWKPVGFLDVERGQVGRPPQPTSVQAPHPLVWEGKWYLFYNSSGARCMISDDGISWRQHKDREGRTKFFDMGRDVDVFWDEPNRRWIAYYCGTVKRPDGKRGAMVARTAPALEGPWSEEETAVRTEGNPESPFVVLHEGKYYLWQQMSAYASDDPLNFNNAPLVAHMTGLWFDGKFAPEIVEKDGQWYVAGYSRGLYVAKFKWVRKTLPEIAVWRETWKSYLREELTKKQQREEARKKAAEAAH